MSNNTVVFSQTSRFSTFFTVELDICSLIFMDNPLQLAAHTPVFLVSRSSALADAREGLKRMTEVLPRRLFLKSRTWTFVSRDRSTALQNKVFKFYF